MLIEELDHDDAHGVNHQFLVFRAHYFGDGFHFVVDRLSQRIFAAFYGGPFHISLLYIFAGLDDVGEHRECRWAADAIVVQCLDKTGFRIT